MTEAQDRGLAGGEMGARIGAVDWRGTPVGSPETWPASLRIAVGIVLASQVPMYLAWGPAFVQFYNDGCRRILGAKHPAALGRTARETFADRWHDLGPVLEKVRAGDGVDVEDRGVSLERDGVHEDGRFTCSYSPVRDEHGDVVGVLVTLVETTTRGHAAEVTRRLAEAERATRSREHTLAIVSHDLRTPLAAISGAVQLLERSLGTDERDVRSRRRTDVIRRSVDRMDRMLADLLDAASIDAGTLSIDPRPHASAELIRELRESFEPQAEDRGLTLCTAVDPDVPVVTCDKQRVLQVLANLLSNALKFTDRGGEVRVRVERDQATGDVRFSVADSGSGVPREAHAHVFDRHWRGAQRDRDGHGLGLSIARGIVETHGGRIGLDSAPGAGSTFWFTVPDPTAPAGDAGVHAMPPGADDSFVQGGGECGALIRAFDWSTTCLGAIAQWPQSLRTSVSTMLRSPYPIILFWGRDLAMLYNDPFRPILGEKHPGTVGASAHEALAEAWGILGPLMRQALATGEPLYVENGAVFFARLPGGVKEEAYFTWSYNPTIGETGGVAGLFAIASETTRQVVGDRRLGLLRELSLRTAFDRTVDGVFRSIDSVLAQAGADVPFALLYLVEAGRARLVVCTGLVRGAPAAPIALAPGPGSPWPLERVVRSGQELVIEVNGELGPLPGGPWPEPATRALLLAVAMGADTETTGVLVAGLSPRFPLDDEYSSFLQLLTRQISACIASARAYEQETQRAEKLAALDRAKTDFFSNLSHEFRTPLTLILGPVEAALAGPGRALAGSELELVRRNAMRLHKMVNSLLDFSRIEAGRTQACFVPTDLAAVTADLASHFSSAAATAGLGLVVDCPPLPEPIFVDPEMWEKIVLNLLSNAIKYTHRGEVRVGLAVDDEAAIVRVADTGVGIAADELPRIFDRFYRVRATQGRSHEGTGIGLALARGLVELHGGSIAATSEPGVGTTFTVRMPRGAAHLPAERTVPHASPHVPSPAVVAAFVEEAQRWSADDERAQADDDAAAVPASRTAARILVVDDNADLRSYVAGLLGRVYADVETATHGDEALVRARAAPPDLIVSDVMMPVMDGFELVRALRADERTRSVPILLLSARAGDESTVEGLASGADDYLVKPFSARELLARVRGQLEMSRVRGEVGRERGEVEALRRSVAARDEFIALSSHELRTPLTALQLQLEGLLRLADRGSFGEVDVRLTDKLGVALRQTDRMSRLVETLLDASRTSLGALELSLETVDLGQLARTVVARFEADAHASGASFRLELAAVHGRWDRARVDQVLTSLLSNAVKYAPGTVIAVVVAADGDTARLVVRDAGIGITATTHARMFDRFERGVSVDSYGGFGFGLYLARRIVEAHGGTIEADATPGGGTTLTVKLPRSPGGPAVDRGASMEPG